MDNTKRNLTGIIPALLILAAGCVSTSPHAVFEEVEANLEERGVESVHWHTGVEEDEKAEEKIRQLLDDDLTAESAVQITLLNNRRLQAVYSTLGVAQADLVQAGLLSNPVLSGSLLLPVNGGSRELELGVTQSFLEVFYIPLRRRVAASALEESKLVVTASVLDFKYHARTAFYKVQAYSQRLEMFEQIALATELGYDMAQRLHDAGNITALELHEHRDLFEQARLDLRLAERDFLRARERLNRIMGIFGKDIEWTIADRLPHIPDDEPDLEGLESRVIEKSMDLAIARQRIITAGELLGFEESSALVPELAAGAKAEYEAGDWRAGPTLALPIPFFDRGQARIARNRAELRMQQDDYKALAIEIRSIARQAREDVESARQISDHYHKVILPIRERITGEAQLQYNAMQIGLFELLRARERQIEAGEKYLESLLSYWKSRAAIELMLSGRTPQTLDGESVRAAY